MYKFVSFSIVAALMLGIGGCGAQSSQDDLEWQTQGRYAETVEMGPVVEESRRYLEELTMVVEANIDDPTAARERVQAFLEANREGLEANAVALNELHASMEGEAAEIWETSFAVYMEDAMGAWYDAGVDVRERDEREWERIERLLDNFIR